MGWGSRPGAYLTINSTAAATTGTAIIVTSGAALALIYVHPTPSVVLRAAFVSSHVFTALKLVFSPPSSYSQVN